ncbi:S-ribosylhomocysteinase LuxS [Leptotrichia sp. oral taxon 215 str. W9775]|jgi:S-ribosylhomocysteine lyase|uniref:S-ribosylhomocysteine lyase n=1 Tax=Leptotrichia sp. oral taxon 215 TaxID=712359 RepID=UPI0003AD81A8|nr:S-ribosylhomocysteine lyase [Leptotrichia sp. oral taxon 215]ERK67556.1 S-ribosylhomocysteinase LuxS [Leptotrichia sp. oral taxon 215 str. W9775]MBF1333283.1 S-ribosylhomocysteine lyase [Leptotrichia sp.]
MERIASFQVDHVRLNRGLYVSRIDEINGNYLTSFDIRMKLPNREPVINIAELHTMEHLGATFLRNHPIWKEQIVYFGPMGCRTGFYLILKGKLESKDIVDLMKELYKFMAEFKGDIPGATAIECGNYLDQNLPMANYEAKKYLEETLENLGEGNLNYPE